MAPTTRISSIDLVKGLVMVVMALDHVRDYFHADAFYFDALDLSKTYPALFFTRWVTHFCAPMFSFLAGTSAWFVAKRKTKAQLSKFLFTRGLWLVFVEIVIINFAWFFDPGFHIFALQTIWALGISMIALAGLVWLPLWARLGICLALVFGHNALDGWPPVGQPDSLLWSALHNGGYIGFDADHGAFVAYPVLPWIGIMGLGYQLGALYTQTFAAKRSQVLYTLSAACVGLWLVLDYFSIYGDPTPRTLYPDALRTVLSFLDRNKYPPSLQYTLMTIGPMLGILAWAERWPARATAWLGTFGRVPFFYYVVHLYVIHFMAMWWGLATGFGWQAGLLRNWVNNEDKLDGFGLPLWGVYALWLALVALLYPACRWFDGYKQTHRHQWWLSYL